MRKTATPRDAAEERLWYGEGINSLTVQTMWKFPFFDPTCFFGKFVLWIRDAYCPDRFAIACALAVRHVAVSMRFS